jgi:hypothetical protein
MQNILHLIVYSINCPESKIFCIRLRKCGVRTGLAQLTHLQRSETPSSVAPNQLRDATRHTGLEIEKSKNLLHYIVPDI